MHINSLYQSVLKLLVPLTPEETYATIVDEASFLVDAFRGSLFLESDGVLQRAYSSVPQQDQFTPRKNGRVYQTFLSGEPTVISAKKLKKERPEVRDDLVKLFLYIPLSFNHQTVGVLTLEIKDYLRFSKKNLEMLRLFGSFASLKVRDVELLAQTQEAMHLRDLFISMASHELKTPMTTISGYVQLLNRQVSNNKPINTEWLVAMRKETVRLNNLVKELLEVNQIKSGTLAYQFKLSSVKNVIQRAIDDVGFTHPHHPIILKNAVAGGDLMLNIDHSKMVQAVINILNNAAKFSPAGESIIITLSKDDHTARITVKDKGEGISQRDLDRIFGDLYRGKDTSREGMGLGLYVVKSIIDMHHGTISISSEKNHGTEVSIILPLI